MKKLLSIFLAVLMCVSIVCFTGATAGAADVAEKTLKFKGDGEFKIIQIADLQDSAFATPATYEYLRVIIEEEDPDLIVLTGDNIGGSTGDALFEFIARWQVQKAIDNTMSFFEELNIPVAVTFGNHDGESLISKYEQMTMYEKYTCCIAYDEGENLSGCGTYNLPIYSSDGEKIVYNLWMFDSNMYDEENGGYDQVHEDQIEWYVNTSNALKAQNGGNPVPSMAFQHIIVNEIFDALVEVEAGSANSIQYGNKWLGLPEDAKGALNETPCPGTIDSLQFEKMVEQGDVKAMFFGHDHKNTFEVNYQGIDIINSPTSGFGSYGDDNRGVRVITINENDPSKYETKVISYREKFATDELSEVRFLMNDGNDAQVLNAIRYLFMSVMEGNSFFNAFYEILCLIF